MDHSQGTPVNATTTLTRCDPVSLAGLYAQVRAFTHTLCETLHPEDCCIQSMPDASPTRWHLAHTTWFFEQFLLTHDDAYRPYDDAYAYLFNSYYNAVGRPFPRDRRGLLSRPTLEQICAYRRHVDQAVESVLFRIDKEPRSTSEPLAEIVTMGLHHEQQHQELLLTDIKHALNCNPSSPPFRNDPFFPAAPPAPLAWHRMDEGLYWIGSPGDGFCFDNEMPRHRVFLENYELATRLVTCDEYMQFIDDGGYRRPELWLSAGWQRVAAEGWQAPLYWQADERREWRQFTLAGLQQVDPHRPACHLSFFEADAYARWAGARLPTEAEWEAAATAERAVSASAGNFVDRLLSVGKAIHPEGSGPSDGSSSLRQMGGDVWEWTGSQYLPYPGYAAAPGALGEYNGKFMCNQFVLRGGSCATHSSHIRATYRNFFPPEARWQFSGIRMARSI